MTIRHPAAGATQGPEALRPTAIARRSFGKGAPCRDRSPRPSSGDRLPGVVRPVSVRAPSGSPRRIGTGCPTTMIGVYNTVDSAALFQFAPLRVRDPHDGDVRHAGVREEQLLDRARVDV